MSVCACVITFFYLMGKMCYNLAILEVGIPKGFHILG